MNKLREFESLLLEYNEKINLISRQEKDIWNRHILNSLLLKDFLKKDEMIMDIGTGAGFPGMILALSGFNKMILVESKEKKCAFLHMIKNHFQLNINIINQDVNTLRDKVDVIISRALASIDKLLHMTKNISFNKMVLLKGDKIYEEIKAAKKKWYFTYKVYDRNIIVISNISSLRKKKYNSLQIET